VKRECTKIALAHDGKRAIYVDKINEIEILKYLRRDNRHKKKFQYFTEVFFGGHKVPDLYDKENINDKCKDVTAIKFFKGQENDRIYCKEVTSDSQLFVVIMSILHLKKKSEDNSKREIAIIETVAGYEYEIKGNKDRKGI